MSTYFAKNYLLPLTRPVFFVSFSLQYILFAPHSLLLILWTLRESAISYQQLIPSRIRMARRNNRASPALFLFDAELISFPDHHRYQKDTKSTGRADHYSRQSMAIITASEDMPKQPSYTSCPKGFRLYQQRFAFFHKRYLYYR